MTRMPYRLIDPSSSPRARKILHAVGGIATGILILGVIFLSVGGYALMSAVRETQLTNTARAEADRARDVQTANTAKAAAKAARRIENCTTPGRVCFDRAAERGEKAIVGINEGTLTVIVAALSCQADGITEQTALSRCTVKRSRSAIR